MSVLQKTVEPTECEECGSDIAYHERYYLDHAGKIICLQCKEKIQTYENMEGDDE